MKKIWKKLVSFGVASSLIITSCSIGLKENGQVAYGASTGTGVVALSTSDIEIPVAPAPFQDLDSDQITEEMGIGWNLGNTMDGHSNYAPGELRWNSVVTTKSMIKAVHDLGFNTVRVPVTWGNMINADYSVDEEWMSRVEDIVNYCTAENMYVVINIHHDGAWNGEGSPHGWLDIGGTDTDFAAVSIKFNGLWKTIAERFKNYDEHLIFESMNEVYEDGIGWSNNENEVNRELKRINQLNQSFVNVVRATGSNNAYRWLSVPTKNTQIKTMIEDRFDFQVPTDSINRVMVAAHDYDPWGVSSMTETKVDSYAYQFKALKEQYVDKGIPVCIGEFGFFTGSDEQRAYKHEGICYLLKKYKLIGMLWDVDAKESLIDKKNETTKHKAITDGMMRGFFYDTDSSQIQQTPSIKSLTDFTISQDTVELKVGESCTVNVSDRLPVNSNDVVLWKTDDALTASVSNGKIVARGIGTTIVTAFSQSGTLEKTISVTVEPQEVTKPSTSIETEYTSYNLEQGTKAFLNASILPKSNQASLVYRSLDEAVVTVSTMGKLLAIGLGTTTVTIETTDGKVVKEIAVQVVEQKASEVFDIQLALHAYYMDKEHNYSNTEISSDIVHATQDGQYTLRFDCATDLSEGAKTAGVTNLNYIGAMYIKDYDVSMGTSKRSPKIPGKIRYNSIKINNKELLTQETENYATLKSGVFDTGNPLNVWEGSVIPSGITENKTDWYLTFDGIDSPTVLEVTFTLTGFTDKITTPSPGPSTEPSTEPSAEPSTEPSSEPSAVPSEVPQVTQTPDTVLPTQTPSGTTQKKTTITKIKAKKKVLTVKKNKSQKATFTMTTNNKKKPSASGIKLTVGNKKVVKVVRTSVTKDKIVVSLKGLKKGKTVLIVRSGNKSAKMTIKVKG